MKKEKAISVIERKNRYNFSNISNSKTFNEEESFGVEHTALKLLKGYEVL